MRPVPEKAPAKAKATESSKPPRKSTPEQPKARKKLSYKDQKELHALPAKIAALEGEQAKISTRLSDPSIYAGDGSEGIRLNKRFVEIEEELMECIARWEELEAKTAG